MAGPDPDPKCDVLIGGASFAGLALARALASETGGDISIAMVDCAPPRAAASEGRALAISAASKHLLEAIGVWPTIADAAEPITEIRISDSPLEAGLRPVLLSYANQAGGAEPASYIVPGEALMAALQGAVAADRGTSFAYGAEIVALEPGDAGCAVRLGDGRTLAADLVVAADGRRSRLRELARLKSIGWTYQQIGIVTTVAHDRPHGGIAVQHFLPGGPFAILPLRGNRSSITWSEEAGEAKRILSLDDQGFLAEIDKRFGGRLGALRLDGARHSFPLEISLARSYVGPRIALVGDAAHAVHPIAGQGLNLGLRDVAALAEVIADARAVGLDIGSLTVLRGYERWRRFDATLSAAVFDGLNRLFSNDLTLLRSAREAGLGIVDRLPGLKKLFVEEAAGLAGEVPRLMRG